MIALGMLHNIFLEQFIKFLSLAVDFIEVKLIITSNMHNLGHFPNVLCFVQE